MGRLLFYGIIYLEMFVYMYDILSIIVNVYTNVVYNSLYFMIVLDLKFIIIFL